MSIFELGQEISKWVQRIARLLVGTGNWKAMLFGYLVLGSFSLARFTAYLMSTTERVSDRMSGFVGIRLGAPPGGVDFLGWLRGFFPVDVFVECVNMCLAAYLIVGGIRIANRWMDRAAGTVGKRV